MEIKVAGIDFWDSFQCMRYWSHPKSYGVDRAREEAKHMVLSGQYIGARKKDGIWGMIIKDEDGIFHLRSRTPNVQGTYADKAEWIPSITSELTNVPNSTVILGEIYKYGDEGSRKATSILNCLKDKSLERQKIAPLHFYIFDVLVWKNKNLITTPISERIKYINEIKSCCAGATSLEFAIYKSGEDLWDLYTDVIAKGGEGVVIQKSNAPYTPGKKTARMSLKLKRELTDTIDAFIDGDYKLPERDYTGKTPLENWQYWLNIKTGEKFTTCQFASYNAGGAVIPITKPYALGYAGSLSFSVMKDGCPKHIGYIGGLPDEIKKGIVENPEKWIGKVYKINAMMKECIDGEYSLRHAKVIEPHEDKRPEECDWSQIAEN